MSHVPFEAASARGSASPSASAGPPYRCCSASRLAQKPSPALWSSVRSTAAAATPASTYTHDFIEIFNRGSAAVDITGWTVQYASSAGTTWATTALSGSIPAGGYYLIQEAQGAGGTLPLPTPEASGNIAMSATAAKVALVSNATVLVGRLPERREHRGPGGFGAASCSEGTPSLHSPTPRPRSGRAAAARRRTTTRQTSPP